MPGQDRGSLEPGDAMAVAGGMLSGIALIASVLVLSQFRRIRRASVAVVACVALLGGNLVISGLVVAACVGGGLSSASSSAAATAEMPLAGALAIAAVLDATKTWQTIVCVGSGSVVAMGFLRKKRTLLRPQICGSAGLALCVSALVAVARGVVGAALWRNPEALVMSGATRAVLLWLTPSQVLPDGLTTRNVEGLCVSGIVVAALGVGSAMVGNRLAVALLVAKAERDNKPVKGRRCEIECGAASQRVPSAYAWFIRLRTAEANRDLFIAWLVPAGVVTTGHLILGVLLAAMFANGIAVKAAVPAGLLFEALWACLLPAATLRSHAELWDMLRMHASSHSVMLVSAGTTSSSHGTTSVDSAMSSMSIKVASHKRASGTSVPVIVVTAESE
ncbi:hypothetical protein HK105_203101 [Polyrhizophydium stewartii]|uniref:Uncharacterized protein n=1 Tax=Polyrhizophydium stewartii TaxID=2732419 RepID=A0ABR4ND28_9FUNG